MKTAKPFVFNTKGFAFSMPPALPVLITRKTCPAIIIGLPYKLQKAVPISPNALTAGKKINKRLQTERMNYCPLK